MARSYPFVLAEEETLRQVVAGASIARYGDGEFKLCRGQAAVAQGYNPAIQARLLEILKNDGKCLVGVPNIYEVERRNPSRQKVEFWNQFLYTADWMEQKPYASSFITRPDSAPWIDTPDYWAAVESLWRGHDITLVRGSKKGLTSDDLVGAGTITEIISLRQHAFDEYDELIERIGRPKRALICLGPTATVLAYDLWARGVHAIDLGHIAMFLRKHRRGEPMVLSKDDKSHDKVIA